jgi:hypothetical protein
MGPGCLESAPRCVGSGPRCLAMVSGVPKWSVRGDAGPPEFIGSNGGDLAAGRTRRSSSTRTGGQGCLGSRQQGEWSAREAPEQRPRRGEERRALMGQALRLLRPGLVPRARQPREAIHRGTARLAVGPVHSWSRGLTRRYSPNAIGSSSTTSPSPSSVSERSNLLGSPTTMTTISSSGIR